MLRPLFENDPDLPFDTKRWAKAFSLLNESSTTRAYAYRLTLLRRIITDKVDTMAVDGFYLYVNPWFADKLSLRELAYVMAHECHHVMAQHHLRRGKRNPKGWNIATDAVINSNLDNSFYGFRQPIRPSDGINMPWAIAYSAEGAYDKLKQEHQDKKQQQQQQQQEGHGQGDDAQQKGGGGDSDEQGQGDNPQQGSNGAGGGDPFEDLEEQSWGKVFDRTDEMSEEEVIEAKQKEAQATKRAVNAAQKQGYVPGYLKELVQETESQVDWKEILKDFATSNLVPADYCWHKPNRNYLGMGIYMPGVVRDGVGRLAICVDTSGSICQDALAAFSGETKEIIEEIKPEHVRVIYCDTRVTRVEEFGPGDDFKMEAKGGGGTRFLPAINEALKESPDAIIYFTDMGASDFGQDPGVPFLWAAYTRWGNANPPYGELIDIDK